MKFEMLPAYRVVDRLNRQRAMPGYTIHGELHREGPVVVIRATVPDAKSPVPPYRMTDLRVVTHVPPMLDVEEVDRFVHWRLERIAVHEVDEWHRVDGRPVVQAEHAPSTTRGDAA